MGVMYCKREHVPVYNKFAMLTGITNSLKLWLILRNMDITK